MIAFLAALTLLAPQAVVAKYATALAQVRDPQVFTVQYTLEQTGTRSVEQTHRIFRSGKDERDEVIAVNGTRATQPEVRIFRNRPYRYAVTRLAPRPADYVFTYAGAVKDGHHTDYAFDLTPRHARAFVHTAVVIDGLTFLPDSIAFTSGHSGRGRVTFSKSGSYWVASGAEASAHEAGGDAYEQLTFSGWHFPTELPRSTFAVARPLPSPPTL
ncbi:MAG TPA: hypothetical protein VMD91_11345 [Candidatus Sulfotelmatobacter sp.]|nr:hypothetical protein [Candidatus Sulfotelmatobacter sp.]